MKERKRIVISFPMLGVVLKSQPVLSPASTFVISRASQTAPPVAMLSWTVRYDTVLVPLASLMVAGVPGVALNKNFGFVPDVLNAPTVLVVPAASLSVPLIIVSVLVTDKASVQFQAPPTPLMFTFAGKLKPFDVIVFVPDVAEKVTVPVPGPCMVVPP